MPSLTRVGMIVGNWLGDVYRRGGILRVAIVILAFPVLVVAWIVCLPVLIVAAFRWSGW